MAAEDLVSAKSHIPTDNLNDNSGDTSTDQAALTEALDLPVYGFLDWLQALNDGRARPDGGLTAQSVTGIAR